MKYDLILSLLLLILIGPYSLLFYKKLSFRIKLLFISMLLIAIWCLLITIDFFGNGVIAEDVYFYGIFIWSCVLLNVTLILFSWIIQKFYRYSKK